MTTRHPETANAAQLKHDIDSGLTGDKAPGFDPAAAPLGTDDEAGGAQLSPAMLARMRADEKRGRAQVSHPNAVAPGLTPDGASRDHGAGIGVAVGLGAGALLAIAMLLIL